MKSFLLGVMTGVLGVELMKDNKKSMMKKGKQALNDKIEDILD